MNIQSCLFSDVVPWAVTAGHIKSKPSIGRLPFQALVVLLERAASLSQRLRLGHPSEKT